MFASNRFYLAVIPVVAVFLTAAVAKAELVTIASFDANNSAGGPLQSGFAEITRTSLTATQNGVTLTLGPEWNESRDRNEGGVILGNPNADLLRGFVFQRTVVNGEVTGRVNLSGLTPNTEHEVTIFSFDTAGNNSTVDWYLDAVAGTPLITNTSNSGMPDTAPFSFLVDSDNAGEISLIGDVSNIMLFNGLTIAAEVAVPEPHSIAIWVTLGLGLVGFAYFRIRSKN